MSLTVHALDHLVVNVSDVEVSAAWYARVLGMARMDAAPEDGKPPRTEMRFGQLKINLPAHRRGQGGLVHRRPRGGRQRRPLLPDRLDARRSRPAFEVRGRRDRRRSWSQKRRPRHADVGLLPRPRWQPDRDRVLPGRLENGSIGRKRNRNEGPTTPGCSVALTASKDGCFPTPDGSRHERHAPAGWRPRSLADQAVERIVERPCRPLEAPTCLT